MLSSSWFLLFSGETHLHVYIQILVISIIITNSLPAPPSYDLILFLFSRNIEQSLYGYSLMKYFPSETPALDVWLCFFFPSVRTDRQKKEHGHMTVLNPNACAYSTLWH